MHCNANDTWNKKYVLMKITIAGLEYPDEQ